ncbi:hypothetical protein B0T14DRAFT_521344 [Immersiella caudata]|uniref:Uncharacterized protein n=1 Tax=Immersiella caudata TaxID=314043 RepID=A0AA40C037_9PEZI|nr:hypothetical protein B0T14DRAFT_521344 [Immersiella caudata]
MAGDMLRGGFCSGYGRFRTNNDGERVSVPRLKATFLSKLTPEGKQMLRSPSFVQDQLQHYDVEYTEPLSWNGTLFLKKALQAGKVTYYPTLSSLSQLEKVVLEYTTSQRVSPR